MAKLIVGCGYLGQRVADLWLEDGHTVYATTRSKNRAEEWAAGRIRPMHCDITAPATLANLPVVDTVLFAVGFDRSSDKSIDEVYVEGLKNVLHALNAAKVKRFIYISSTGVFSQTDGSWVDEQSPCNPTREGGKACLAAEESIAASVFASRSIILRLAGIYGPDRLPRLKDLREGNPLPAPSQGFLNLIHVEDAATLVRRITTLDLEETAAPRLYNVSDGHPVLRREYYEEVARQANTPPPQFKQPPAGSPAAARAGSDKRISNAKLLREINPAFNYPDFKAGIAAILGDA